MRIGWRLLVSALLATAALAQSDVFDRLRRVLPPDQARTASEALAKRDFGPAEQLLGEFHAATDTQRAEVLALRGAVEFLGGNMDAAASAFEASARVAPLKESDRFTLAMAFVKLGNRAQARALLGELLEQHPQRAIYLYWLGRLDYDQGRYQDAVEKLTRTTELDERSARAWDSLGLAFDMQGHREQALAAFEKAASLNREQPSASAWPPHDLGYLLLRLDRFAEADKALRESLRYNFGLAQTHLYLGRVLEKQGHTEEAIAEYATAVSDDGAAADACYSLALLYRKSHRDREADQMFFEYRKRRQALGTVATDAQDESSR